MSKIKTRETVKDIKVLDKAAVVGERMKNAYIRSKDTAQNLMDDRQATPSEYAEDEVLYAAEDISRDVSHAAMDTTKAAVNKGKEAFQRRRAEKQAEKAHTEQQRPDEHWHTPRQTGTPSPQDGGSPTGEVRAQSASGYHSQTVPSQTVSRSAPQQVDSTTPQGKPSAVSGGEISPRVRWQRPLVREDAGTVQTESERIVEQGRSLAKKQAERRADAARTVKSRAQQTIKTTDRADAAVNAPDIAAPKSRTAQATGSSAARTSGQTVEKAADTALRSTRATAQDTSKAIKTVERGESTIRQSASSARKSAGKAVETSRSAVKQAGKGTVKTAQKTIKTAQQTSKTAIKTAQATAKTAQKTAQTTAKAAKAAAAAAKAAAKAAVVTAKAVAKAVASAVKAIIAGIKALVAAIAAGGWVAVLVIVIICLIGLLIGSCFGIFFSGEDSGTGQTMPDVVREINADCEAKLEEIKAANPHDAVEMSGSRAVWREVLAIYAVKTTTDPENGQEVASMDDEKKQLLKDIFWQMNVISYRTESVDSVEVIEKDDGSGNIVAEEVIVTKTVLYITVSHKTAADMAEEYGFDDDQRAQLTELLAEENNSLWTAALYGIGPSDNEIVVVALSQVGNVGGEPYWSWYGYPSRVEWCACFVSWCANECGYIENGIIPKFSYCPFGVQWFMDRELWQDNSYEPRPGDIIFFDWDSPNGSSGPQDGVSDHVGIVERVEDGRVYTVEGNSGDSCRQRSFAIGYYEIYGYGTPAY